MPNFITWILAISLTNCYYQVNEQAVKKETVSSGSLNLSPNTDISKKDSLITGKDELTKIYAQAISAYIKAVYKKDKINFNSLFFGKQFDFPDIDLPATINGTAIHPLTPEEMNDKKSLYGKSSPYINLIGFVAPDEAEFIFVTFYPGFQHQFDCYMNFRYNTSKKEFDLDKLRIEALIRNKEGKAEHYAVYEDGKYVGDKPVEEN